MSLIDPAVSIGISIGIHQRLWPRDGRSRGRPPRLLYHSPSPYTICYCTIPRFVYSDIVMMFKNYVAAFIDMVYIYICHLYIYIYHA